MRGVGVLGSMEDIGNIVLSQQGGLPVLLSDVAKIQVGFMPRLGMAGRDDTTDIVFGIVLMQKLERTMEVVKRVRAAIERINSDGTLPPGVKIDAFYDRGDLVAITVRTVLHNMLFGIALIFLIQWIFLGNLRCALIVAGDNPGRAVSRRHHYGAARRIRQPVVGRRDRSRHHRRRAPSSWWKTSSAIWRTHAQRHPTETSQHLDKLHRILAAAVEVDKPIFFSVIITIAAFLPLFTMQGVEGQIFGPMSRTYAYALLGAVIATFTVTPVMSSLLLPDKVDEVETFIVRNIRDDLSARSCRSPCAMRGWRR